MSQGLQKQPEFQAWVCQGQPWLMLFLFCLGCWQALRSLQRASFAQGLQQWAGDLKAEGFPAHITVSCSRGSCVSLPGSRTVGNAYGVAQPGWLCLCGVGPAPTFSVFRQRRPGGASPASKGSWCLLPSTSHPLTMGTRDPTCPRCLQVRSGHLAMTPWGAAMGET